MPMSRSSPLYLQEYVKMWKKFSHTIANKSVESNSEVRFSPDISPHDQSEQRHSHGKVKHVGESVRSNQPADAR